MDISDQFSHKLIFKKKVMGQNEPNLEKGLNELINI